MADIKGWLKNVAVWGVNEIGKLVTGGPIFTGQGVPVATIPINADTLSKIREAVTTVQVLSQTLATPLTGEQKLAAATPLVTQILIDSFVFSGKKVDDPDKFKAGAALVASGVVECLNSIKA